MKTQLLIRMVTDNGVDAILPPDMMNDAESIMATYIKYSDNVDLTDLITSLDTVFSRDMLISPKTGDSWDFWRAVVYTRMGWQA